MRQHSASTFCALFLIVACAALASGPRTWAEDDKKTKTKEKEKPKEKEEIEVKWTQVFDITATAPGNGATYIASKEFKTEDRAIRVKAKLSSAQGKGGTMVMTLHKLGRPPKKIPLMKHSREGEKEVVIAIEPGDYKLEISVSNVNATATVETGKKK